jgi:PAS domain S-box-containing protein
MYFNFYQTCMILSLLVSVLLVMLTWRRRHLPAAPAMIALMTAIFLWTLGFFLEANSSTLDRQLFFNNIGYLGSMAVPPAWFVFSTNYTNSVKFMRGWRLILLCIIPFVITIFIWTNDWHHLMWYNAQLVTSGQFTITSKSYGPLFWAALAHNYLLIIAGSVILLRRLFVGTRLYTKQALALIVAVSLPWIWNIIYVFQLVPLPRKDLTPVMFAISGAMVALGVLRFHLFTTVPFAREFIIRQLRDAVFIFDIRNNLVEANPMALKIAGTDQRIVGKKLEDLLSLSPLFQHLTATGALREELVLEITGEQRYFEMEITFMYIGEKHPAGRLVILHDITERRKSEEQYRLVTENSADIIYKLDIKNERFTFVSPAVRGVLGYTEVEALFLTPKDIILEGSLVKQRAEMEKAIKNGHFQSTLTIDAIHRDGHIVPLEVHSSFISDESGHATEAVGVARDVTQRRKMENQLVIQDRLVSIGQLTSGIAHELNNPLTGIINYASLLLKRDDLPDDIRQDIVTINEEAQRTAFIVKNLITFARKQRLDKEPVNITEGIQKVLTLRAYEQKVNNIHVNLQAGPGMLFVLGNAPQLQQVFFNIVINAEFFMLEVHKEGTLDIKAEKTENTIKISFTDDGPGIPKENITQIFTPLFTTKEPGIGTGLGLSICQSIITEHGGQIWAESQPGKGSTFFIELPVYIEPATKEDD